MKARPDGLEPGVGVCTTVPGEGHSGPSGLGPVGESVEPRWTLPTLGGEPKGRGVSRLGKQSQTLAGNFGPLS